MGYLNILILFPLFLSTEEIGLYRVLLDAALFLAVFAAVGIPDATIKFFPYFKDKEKKHNGILTYAVQVAFMGFLLCALVFFMFQDSILENFSNNSPLLTEYRNYLLPLTLLILLYNIFTIYARALLRIVIPKVIRELFIRLLVAAGTILYYVDVLTFQEFITWIVASYGLALAALLGYIYTLGHLFLKPDYSVFKSPMLKEVATFSLFTVLGTGSGVIVAKIDTLMLGSMSGLSAVGVYGVAFYLGSVIQLPRRNLVDISAPIIARAFKSDDTPKIVELYRKTSLNLLLAGAFLFTGIWTNIDSVFQLIPNSESFVTGIDVVMWIGLAKLIDMSFGVNHEIITNSKYYRWNMFFLPFLAVLTVVSNLILIPKYGIVGAGIASFFSITFTNLIRFLFVLIVLKMHPITFNTFKALIIAGMVFYIAILIPQINNLYLDILLRGTVITLSYLVLLLLLKPSEDIHNLLLNLGRRIGFIRGE